MAKKKKAMAKTTPMRILEEKGISFEPRQQARKQLTAEGVAGDLEKGAKKRAGGWRMETFGERWVGVYEGLGSRG